MYFFFRKLPLTHPLLSIENLKQILDLYDHGTHVKVKKNIWTLWACGAPKGPWPDFFFYYLIIQISFGRNNFNLNPQNGNYLYRPFFPKTMSNEEKTTIFECA